MDDDELRGQTADFKQRFDNGETLDSLLPEAFATVREATKRVLGKRHFDVQIIGGAALHQCNIAEMKTGEGKTLVATLPSYLNALDGQRRARRHGQRLPGQVPVRADGPRPPLPGPDRGCRSCRNMTPPSARRPTGRHHLRHQQRVRLRLPARQHGADSGGLRAARPLLRHRRRGRLDPGRRGPHPADHLRPRRGRTRSGTRCSRRLATPARERDRDYEVDEKKRTIAVLEPRHRAGRGRARASTTCTSPPTRR